jgi:hypothetical protein
VISRSDARFDTSIACFEATDGSLRCCSLRLLERCCLPSTLRRFSTWLPGRFATCLNARFATCFNARFGTCFDARFDTWVDTRFEPCSCFDKILIARFVVARFDCSTAAVFLLPFVAWVPVRFDTCFDARFDPWVLVPFDGRSDACFDSYFTCFEESLLALILLQGY